jgi:hypothetical protein
MERPRRSDLTTLQGVAVALAGLVAGYTSPAGTGVILPFLPIAFLLIGRRSRDAVIETAALARASASPPALTSHDIRDAMLSGARDVGAQVAQWWSVLRPAQPPTARTPAEMRTGAVNADGETINFIYFQDKDYAIYRSASRVRIAFSDDAAVAREQRTAVAELLDLRDFLATRIVELGRDSARSFEWRIAQSFCTALEGESEHTRLEFERLAANIGEQWATHRRRVYCSWVLGSALSIAVGIAAAAMCYSAVDKPTLVFLMGASGAAGALLSRLLALTQASEPEYGHLRPLDAIFAALLGSTLAVTLFFLLESNVLSFRIGAFSVDNSALNWQAAILAGFLIGFAERAVSARLDKVASALFEQKGDDDRGHLER